ncbi:MAG: hypothetical protein KJ042_11735, partial [Deltaproteobacteria bacterium]|nr:hypothetical protein [Deltaproteobacteria bacterium]
MFADGTVADTTMSIDDANNGIGALLTSSVLTFENTTMELGDAGTQNYGLYSVTSIVQWNGGSIAMGEAPAGTNMGVNSTGSSLTMNGAAITTGDSDSLNAGILSAGGLPGARLVLTNNVVSTGDANDTNYGILSTAIESVIGQNTVVAGAGGVTRAALFLTIGGTEFRDPVVFNNHFGSGPSAGDAFAAYILPGAPFRKVVFVGNNLDGNVDALVYDGTNSVTDIDEVNACDFLSCRESGGNLDEDPNFAGADDFHPGAGSPLIDAGVNPLPYLIAADEPWVWYDIGGSPRPVNGTWDIGAYEVD